MKQKFVNLYMKWAEDVAQLSYCVRLKVGCIIVKDEHMFIGYNGTPPGDENICEYVSHKNGGEMKTRPDVIHAEANACDKIARSEVSGIGATAFVTHAPCIHCAKQLAGAGIKTIYYKYDYRDDAGIKYLEKRNIEVNKINEENYKD